MMPLQTCTLTLAVFLLCPAGCASIVGGGTHETVRVSSNPSGAHVCITDQKGKAVHTGTTPFSVSLKRGAGYFANSKYDLTATAPGYPEKSVPAHAKLNGWYVGNIVFGGLIGFFIVDPISGAMWDLPDNALIEFSAPQRRQTSPAAEPAKAAAHARSSG